MRTKALMHLAAVAALTMTTIGCEDPPPPAPAPTKPTAKTTGPTGKEEPKPAAPTVTGDKLGERVKQCFAAMDAKDEKTFKDCHAATAKQTLVDNLPPMSAEGYEAIHALHKPFETAFPDMKHELGVILVNGNNAVALGAAHATNSGEMMGKPATNKTMGLLFADLIKTDGTGKATEINIWMDQNSMMGQLGMLPKEAKDHYRPAEKPGSLGATTVVVAKNDGGEKANLAAWDKGTEAFNKHDVAAVMAMYASDALFRENGRKEDVKGTDAIKKGLEEFYKMSSDVKSNVQWKWTAGDYVVSASSTTGTHDGEVHGMKASKKTFTVSMLEVGKFQGGKITEHWLFGNGYKFAVDTGMAPPPEEPSAKGDEDDTGATKPATDAKSKSPTGAPKTEAKSEAKSPSGAPPAKKE